MSIFEYIAALGSETDAPSFEDTLAVIDAHYDFTPTAFQNGSVEDAAGTNSGSCKVFSFAKLHGLNETQTLAMFARHYQDVLADSDGSAHGNIRAFMVTGMDGVSFAGEALAVKAG